MQIEVLEAAWHASGEPLAIAEPIYVFARLARIPSAEIAAAFGTAGVDDDDRQDTIVDWVLGSLIPAGCRRAGDGRVG